MLSIFNVMSAQAYRLKAGFWPLFFAAAAVGIAAAGAWSQCVGANSAGVSQANANAMLPWLAPLSLVLGVMACHALLRSLLTSMDSNYLRSRSDRLVCSFGHMLMALAIIVSAVCIAIAAGQAVRVLSGLPVSMLGGAGTLAWVFQATLATWAICLAGLCAGYMRRSSGTAALVVALFALGIPGDVLALPFSAGGCGEVAAWLSANQPRAWIGSLAQNQLLSWGDLAALTSFCAVLVALLCIVSARRNLK